MALVVAVYGTICRPGLMSVQIRYLRYPLICAPFSGICFVPIPIGCAFYLRLYWFIRYHAYYIGFMCVDQKHFLFFRSVLLSSTILHNFVVILWYSRKISLTHLRVPKKYYKAWTRLNLRRKFKYESYEFRTVLELSLVFRWTKVFFYF